jgi:hypothetical protein
MTARYPVIAVSLCAAYLSRSVLWTPVLAFCVWWLWQAGGSRDIAREVEQGSHERLVRGMGGRHGS